MTSKESGMGKTAFLAKVASKCMQGLKNSCLVVPYFPEALAQNEARLSSFLTYIKATLNELLQLRQPQDEHQQQDQDLKALKKDLNALLSSLSCLTSLKVLLIVDELDGDEMDWMPSELPDGLLMLVSTQNRSKLKTWLCSLPKSDKILKAIVLESLTLKERELFAQKQLSSYGKCLKSQAFDNQVSSLVMKKEAGNPCFLKMLCLELSKFGVFEQVSAHIEEIGNSVPELLSAILARTEMNLGAKNHRDLKAIIPLLMASSHFGLSEPELVQMTQISQMSVCLIFNGLETFFKATTAAGRIVIKEGVAKEILMAKFCTKSTELLRAHKTLLEFYKNLFDSSQEPDSISIEALPYHLSAMNEFKQLMNVITSLKFISSSFNYGLMDQLVFYLDGGSITSKLSRDKFATNAKIVATKSFLGKYQEVLSEKPHLLYQLALNDSEMKANIQIGDEALMKNWKCLTSHTDANAQEGLVRTKNSLVKATSFAVENSRLINPEHIFMAHGFADGSIQISLAKALTRLFGLFGHAGEVTALAFLHGDKISGDSFLVSGSDDGDIAFWDLNGKIRVKLVSKAHKFGVSGLSSSLDGLTLVSIGLDGLCKVWSGRGFRLISTLKSNDCPLSCVEFHPEKDFVLLGDWRGKIKVWDLTTCKRKAILQDNKGSIQDLKMSMDGQKIASLDISGTLCIFEGTTLHKSN